MHIPPEVWGPMFWSTLHIVSLAYPAEPSYSEKRAAKEFFNALAFLLPCPVCREHFKEVLQGMPIDSWLDNRNSLIEWVWSAHNRVNAKLGKREITQAEFYQRYQEMADRALPIPPASPTAEISTTMLKESYIRGASHAVGAVACIAALGGLLWISYKK